MKRRDWLKTTALAPILAFLGVKAKPKSVTVPTPHYVTTYAKILMPSVPLTPLPGSVYHGFTDSDGYIWRYKDGRLYTLKQDNGNVSVRYLA